MPPILQIRKQGFPAVLDELGVVQPLQGPFWGFEPTISPVIVVGDVSVKQSAGQPYFFGDFDSDSTSNPGDAAVLTNTGPLPSGRYGIEFLWAYAILAVNGSFLTYAVIDAANFTQRQITFDVFSASGAGRDFGNGQIFVVEDLNEGDRVEIINLSEMLLGSVIRSTCKWFRLEGLSFKVV